MMSITIKIHLIFKDIKDQNYELIYVKLSTRSIILVRKE